MTAEMIIASIALMGENWGDVGINFNGCEDDLGMILSPVLWGKYSVIRI